MLLALDDARTMAVLAGRGTDAEVFGVIDTALWSSQPMLTSICSDRSPALIRWVHPLNAVTAQQRDLDRKRN
ncbi:hypothetical protein [Mesorhizobium loti]|uniref:hypothetical protein n=1 Tax=Rhizobium loti TaxID=381 RepID=UPI0012698539|nr:hypothetical protein [Mesorhizobium loti]